MLKNIDLATDYITSPEDEGGWVLKKNGAAANFGVGMLTLITWRHANGKPIPVLDDLKELTRQEAKQIYASNLYAGGVHFNDLPSGLDYAMLDAAVNEGVAGAMRFFAQAMEVSNDTAIQIKALCQLRLAAKMTRKDWNDYTELGEKHKGHGEGWTKRIGKQVPERALAMLDKQGGTT